MMQRRLVWLACCAILAACGSRSGRGGSAVEGQAGTEGSGAGGPTTSEGGPPGDDAGAAESLPVATGQAAGAGEAGRTGAAAGPCLPIPAPLPTATTTVNWDRDDSSDCPAGQGAANIVLPDNAVRDMDLCAAVAGIRPPADPAGFSLDPYATVVLTGDAPEGERSFLVRVPVGTPLPFAVGDVLSVRIHAETIRIHQVVHATIADPSGRLLLALSGDGVPAWAPDWLIRQLDVAERQEPSNAGGAERREHYVGLSHDGRVARVHPEKCRMLETTDGTWLLAAGAVSYGEGTRLPDSAEYLQYSILRRAAP